MLMESGEQLREPSAVEPFGDVVELVLKLLRMLCAHCCEDVRGASRQRGWAEAVMRNRGLRNRVVQR